MIKKTAETLLRVLILLAIILRLGCKKNPVGPEVTPNVQLSVEYVMCNEVWLKVGFADNPGGGDYIVTRDGKTVLAGSFSGASVTVRDSTVQASMSYTYTAGRLEDGQISKISPPLQLATLDSTSDNFVWTSYTFGDGNGLYFNDVTVIDDTLAYAVGQIYLTDSTNEQEVYPHNLGRWDGTSWQLEKISVPFRGSSIVPNFEGVMAFSPVQVWIAAGMAIFGHDNSWTPFDVRLITGYDTLHFSKCWGPRADEMYFAGLAGSLGSYTNGTWRRIESGTRSPFVDIWGIDDQAGGTETVYCVANDPVQPSSSKILKLTNGSRVDAVAWDPSKGLYTIWTCPGAPLYAGGPGLWRNVEGTWQQIGLDTRSVELRIRGNAPNDIFVVGTFGLLAHYNGSTWKIFRGVTSATFYSVSVKGNTVIAVGVDGLNGAILVGRRL